MYEQVKTSKEKKSGDIAGKSAQQKVGGKSIPEFIDNRPGGVRQLNMAKMMRNSTRQAGACNMLGAAQRKKRIADMEGTNLKPGQSATQLKRYNPHGDANAGRDHRIWMRTAGAAMGKAYPLAGADKANRNAAMAETSRLIAATVGRGEIPSPLDGENIGSWVDNASKLNKSAGEEPKLDPFNMEYTTKYSAPTLEDQTAKNEMKTVVHFGATKPGYIVSQFDDTHESHIESGMGGGEVYGADHVNTGTETLTHAAGITKSGSTEPTQDAWEVRTSIMGEGARFQPIRELNELGHLARNTRFYFTATDLPLKNGGKVDGVNTYYYIAYQMYQKWGQVFRGGFDISKGDMVVKMKAAILANCTTKKQITRKLNIQVGAPGGGAYNLDG